MNHHLENVCRWFNFVARIILDEVKKRGLTTTHGAKCVTVKKLGRDERNETVIAK